MVNAPDELGDELAAALAGFTRVTGAVSIDQLGLSLGSPSAPHKELSFHSSSNRGNCSLPQLALEAGVVGGATRVLEAVAARAGGSGALLAARFAHSALAVLSRVGTSAAVARVEVRQPAGDPFADGPFIEDPDGTTRPAFGARRGRQQGGRTAAERTAAAAASVLLPYAERLAEQLRQPAVVQAVAAAVRALSTAPTGPSPAATAASSSGPVSPASPPGPFSSKVASRALWRVLDRAARFAHNLLWGMWLDLTPESLASARLRVYRTEGREPWPDAPPTVPQLLTLLQSSGLLEGLATAMLGAPAPASAQRPGPGPAADAGPEGAGSRQRPAGGGGGSQAAAPEVVGLAIANLARALSILPLAVKLITKPSGTNTRVASPVGLQALRLLLSPAVQQLQRCLLERYCMDGAAAAAAAAAAAGATSAAATATAAAAAGDGGGEAGAGEGGSSGGGTDGGGSSAGDGGGGGGSGSGWAALDACRLPRAELLVALDLSLPLSRLEPQANRRQMSPQLAVLRTWEVCSQLDLLGAGPVGGGDGGGTVQPPPLAVVLGCARRALRAMMQADTTLLSRRDTLYLTAALLHLALLRPVSLPALRDEACALDGLGAALQGMAAAADTAEYARRHYPLALMDDERAQDLKDMAEVLEAAVRVDDEGGVAGLGTPLAVLLTPGARGRVAQVMADTRWPRTLEAALRLCVGAQPVLSLGNGARGSLLQMTGPGGVASKVASIKASSRAEVSHLAAAFRQLGGDATPEGVAALLGINADTSETPSGALLLTLEAARALPPPPVVLQRSTSPTAGGDAAAAGPSRDAATAAAAAAAAEAAQDVCGLLTTVGKVARWLAFKAVQAEAAAGSPMSPLREPLAGVLKLASHMLAVEESKCTEAAVYMASAGAMLGMGACMPVGNLTGSPVLVTDAAAVAAAELRGAGVMCVRACVRAATCFLEAVAAKAPPLVALMLTACGLLVSRWAGWGTVSQAVVPVAPERLLKAMCALIPSFDAPGTNPLYLSRLVVALGSVPVCLSQQPGLGGEVAAWLQPPPPPPPGGAAEGGGAPPSPGCLAGPTQALVRWLQGRGHGNLAALLRDSLERAVTGAPDPLQGAARSGPGPGLPDLAGWAVPQADSGAPGVEPGSLDWRLPRACCNPDCTLLDGPREAELPLAVCGGCRAVRYCRGGDCQREAWRGGHKQVCATLAAERRRQAAQAAAAPAGADE
ncbi:hypothetical protein HYH03_000525 [Edaphochlamys debaryana]|uniref:MYND-type domain-containing protein n=1 Tax=Edaphochlamys debaryana TaxID=47281 RepID=A0A836C697_9CHLO|nr:hypothetical protein HYH03_000525 [Edaphochlamys debaryana]|eukprot:KAG2502031.1 hypothetical protein HYH03_000525 [Edaphochlamys debaryana]